MRFLKGSAVLMGLACMNCLLAAKFTTQIISWSGPWSFTPISSYADPAIEHIMADQRLRAEGANQVRQFSIVSELHCLPGWWLTGQSVMTIDGALRWNSHWDPQQFLKIETTFVDLDSGNQYATSSGLYSDGRAWGGAVSFTGAAKNVRVIDRFTLSTGPDGIFSEWESSNHYMVASQSVPEPSGWLALGGALAIAASRILWLKRMPC